MNTMYLIVGGIGSGKSSIGKALFSNNHLDYVSSDLYKKIFFDTIGEDLSIGYRKADLFVEYKMEKNCKNDLDFIYEICPTNQRKIDKITHLIKKYKYKVISFIISTDDVNINICRTLNRYKFEGGDPISKKKIYSRYFITLDNIPQIVKISNEIYFIDNSKEIKKIAYLDNNTLHIFEHTGWFTNFILNKIHN